MYSMPFGIVHCCGSGWPNSKSPAFFRTSRTYTEVVRIVQWTPAAQTQELSTMNPPTQTQELSIHSQSYFIHTPYSCLPSFSSPIRSPPKLLDYYSTFSPVVNTSVYLLSSHIWRLWLVPLDPFPRGVMRDSTPEHKGPRGNTSLSVLFVWSSGPSSLRVMPYSQNATELG